MLFRLLIIIVLAVVIYRGLKSWLGQDTARQQRRSDRQSGQIDDDMVQDPLCGIYFPRRQGIAFRDRGKDLLFCSEKCKQNYVQRIGNAKGSNSRANPQ